MSYGLVPYACDVGALRRLVGVGVPVGDTVLVDLREKQRQKIAGLDRWFAGAIAAGAPSLEQALTQLILGGRAATRRGASFGYALEILTEHVGHRLMNSTVYPAGLAFLDEVDEALARIGIPEPFRLSNLAFSGPPVPLGDIPDFPAIGWLDGPTVCAAREAFRTRRVDAQAHALSTEVLMALGQIDGWTVDADGRALVGFYY